jgi:hypothetical protein
LSNRPQGHFKRAAIEKSLAELDLKLETLRERNSTKLEELQCTKKCYLILRKMNEMRSW